MSIAEVKDPYRDMNLSRIMIDRRILLPSSEVPQCILHYYERSKGDGARKLHYAIKRSYYGIGQKTIQREINSMPIQQKRRPKFHNIALKPIKENNILKRNQIDIVDMSSTIMYKHDGNTYRYILSIMDVFSRYIWLRPLKTKEAREVAHTAKCIFMEWGTPCRVQTDQGNEFKGEFKRLCEELNIQLITSAPHHPQSQGKDERSHQTWKSKI